MEGTLIQLLIDEVCSKTLKTELQIYKPRRGRMGEGKRYLSYEQYAKVKTMCGEMLRRFEYVKPSNENNNNGPPPILNINSELSEAYFTEDDDLKQAPNYGKKSTMHYPDKHGAPHGPSTEKKCLVYHHTMKEINEEVLFRVSKEEFKATNNLFVDNFHEGIKKKRKHIDDDEEIVDARTIKNYLRGNVTLVQPGKLE